MKSFKESITFENRIGRYTVKITKPENGEGFEAQLIKDYGMISERSLTSKHYTKSIFAHQTFKCRAFHCMNESILLNLFFKMVEESNSLPDNLPAIPQEHPKDGDFVSLHKNHNVVLASANGSSYQYCRDCKVEVVGDPEPLSFDFDDIFFDALSSQDFSGY